MASQKELSKAERRDAFFGGLRAFGRSLGEVYGYPSDGCYFCEPDGAQRDSYGRPHTATCPWCQVGKAVIAALEQEQKRKQLLPLCPTCTLPLDPIGSLNKVSIWGHRALEGPGSCGVPA